ncbi:bifunctional aspartate kinase/homoserine dehydrogenase I [Croceivirga thetidis]|uniref:Bifunctional aspartate kinase/homoserine dehydrogenase I n=1 Tax=Croceivirga thetidis TaxID=2721623 RepID=A0ABX1GSE0_9FLAO|nr:bifunctional aspartate kinase/homoserine dehydrogenase I [Croceivirga thetidis]NKI31961.1 bifunctional aspartate kinase/homoserine dehydrogenase I [Croceivirga thetidis]
MKVLKFGGTSVANAKNINLVKQIVSESAKEKKLVVVVSALGGITDLLLTALNQASNKDYGYENTLSKIEKRHLDTIKSLFPITKQSTILSWVKGELNDLETLLEGAFLIGETTSRLSDKVVSYGELLSSYIISEYFKSKKLGTILKSGRELITTDANFAKANVDFKATDKTCKEFFRSNDSTVVVVPGFVASSVEGDHTTLGRGGSDYTAAIIAAAIDAEELQIWTDVSGMFTANPKIVKQAKCVSQISYEEAMELSHFGAKVLYPPTVQPVLAKEIPIRIKNTFEPQDEGTLITKKLDVNDKTVKGISHVGNTALISLEGPSMIGIPGVSKRFFETLSSKNISVVLITQASSEHSICVGIDQSEAKRAENALNQAFEYEILTKRLKPVIIEKDLAIIALVGENMKSHQGLSGKMFSTLGKNNVNIRAIAQGASERNISAVIDENDVKKALNSLHEAFFESITKQLNLYIMGVGNVGSKLMDQLNKQKSYLKNEMQLNVRVIGISNSRKMVFREGGINTKKWEEELEKGQKADLKKFLRNVQQLNYRNSIFVDNTASEEIAFSYNDYLKSSISVVTCNKIACSSAYSNYTELKQSSKKYNSPFLFETNVGAGLPILDTLRHLITSGDRVHKIQAVLSGSLNFVFNNFNSEITFEEIVKQAQEEGYTEPDPKIDLSGVDVMRKILILARESGYELNIDDIKNDSFLPQEALETNNNTDFFNSLKKHEEHFQSIYKKANEKNCKLKYVARFENGKAIVGLQEIPVGHDFYNLEGSDNIVLFFTDRYRNQPLIIKGAGAGADVTASGIFADIIRIANY